MEALKVVKKCTEILPFLLPFLPKPAFRECCKICPQAEVKEMRWSDNSDYIRIAPAISAIHYYNAAHSIILDIHACCLHIDHLKSLDFRVYENLIKVLVEDKVLQERFNPPKKPMIMPKEKCKTCGKVDYLEDGECGDCVGYI